MISVPAVLGVALSCAAYVGFIHLTNRFGFDDTKWLGLLFLPAVYLFGRLIWRWRMPSFRDVVSCAFVVLICTTATVFVVRDWHDKGKHLRHEEDLTWREFENQIRQDPAFDRIEIHLTARKHIYWAEGSVTRVDDLRRLRELAISCGIKGGIEGPYSHSESLTIHE